MGAALRKIFPNIPKLSSRAKVLSVIIFDSVAYFGLIFAFSRVEGDDITLFLLILYVITIGVTVLSHYSKLGVDKVILILKRHM